MTARWLVTKNDRPEVHVLPIDDLREHDETTTCWCDPKLEQFQRVLVIHNALDGRELVERHGLQ